MKKIIIFFSFTFLINASFGAEKNMKSLQWFKNSDCHKMQIVKHKSASSKIILKEKTISDVDYIKSFQSQINLLPSSGEKMIDFAPDVDYLTLEFSCNGEKEIVEFYNSQIKTPATSFYMKNESADKNIWNEIQLHLEKPVINKALPKVKNIANDYGDFTVEFLGAEDRTPKGTTASLYIESFKVINKKDKHEQIVEIRSGQLSPRPQSFKVNSEKLVASTFADKDGVRLNSRMFIIY